MITKKNLWFLSLFSIILVMAIYYVSIPGNEDLLVSKDTSNNNDVKITLNESSNITALKVSREEMLEKQVEEIKGILTNENKTSEEKNDAYQSLKNLNSNKGKEERLESLINNRFNYQSYVEIDGTNVKIVVDAKDHSYDLASKIISEVEKEFDNKVYVTITFNSK